MFEKIWLRLKENPSREKWIMGGVFVVLLFLSLWVSQSPQADTLSKSEGDEIGTQIPMGFVVLPLELANTKTLGPMIHRHAVIDVFLPRQNRPVSESLKIIKLENDSGPLFGALVPQKSAGSLQELFSRPTLRGAVRPDQSGKTIVHELGTGSPLLMEIRTED